MTNTKTDVRQTQYVGSLPTISSATNPTGDAILSSVNTLLTSPFQLTATSSPSLVVNVGAISLTNAGTGGVTSVPPISGSLPTFTSGTVTFPSSSGGTITVSPGTNGTLTLASGQYMRVGISVDTSGNINLAYGTAAGSAAAALPPAVPSTMYNAGNVLLQNSGGAIQNIAQSAITQYVGSNGGGGGSGTGEINVVTNPSASSDLSGWTGATRNTTSSPLAPITTTAFSVANVAGAESNTSGAYTTITMPTGLQNKKLKVEFYFTSPVTDVYALSVWSGATRKALTTDSAGATNLPAGTAGKFTAYFDADNSSTYTVHLTRTSGTTGPLLFTSLIVGPGIQPQGAVVGPWIAYTPTLVGLGAGSTSTNNAQYRQVGDSIEISFVFQKDGTAGSGSAGLELSLPSGMTVNTSAMPSPNPTNQQLGATTAYVLNTSTANWTTSKGGTNAGISFIEAGGTYVKGSDVAANMFALGNALVPVNELAGAGTVNLAQNDVEYAYNTGNVTAAGASDTTSFGYGPGGVAIGAINSSTYTGNSITLMRVRFQRPIQTTDSVVLEVSNNGTDWMPASSSFMVSQIQGTAQYGAYLLPVNITDVDVYFGNGGVTPGSAYGTTTSSAWSGVSGWFWRVKKSSGGQAVGFGIVNPGTSSGLVSAAGLPGATDGNNTPAGYVGEQIVVKNSASDVGVTTAGTWQNIDSIVLPAGRWSLTLQAICYANSATTDANFSVALSTLSGNVTTDHYRGDNQMEGFAYHGTALNPVPITVTDWTQSLAGSGTVYFKITADQAGARVKAYRISARRIA